MKIAVAQMKISHANPTTNMHRAEAFVERAVKHQADVVLFPEDMLTGSIFGDHEKMLKKKDFCRFFQKLARQYQIDIIPGTYMEKVGKGFYNTAHYIDYQGKILATYRKINLYLCERGSAIPGEKIRVFRTRFGKASLAICWDITSPEIFRSIAKRGGEIVYCPSYWWKEIAKTGLELNRRAEEMKVDAICKARAYENNLTFVYSNAAGVMKDGNGEIDTLIGHSQVITPIYGRIAFAGHNRETMLVADIDLSINQEAEKNYLHRNDIGRLKKFLR